MTVSSLLESALPDCLLSATPQEALETLLNIQPRQTEVALQDTDGF